LLIAHTHGKFIPSILPFPNFRVNDSPLKYTSYGKPNPFVFKNAEAVLAKIVSTMHQNKETTNEGLAHFCSTLYMVGDNPKVDINGAKQVCLTSIAEIIIFHSQISV
jgi:ribonucleotide monophosphatase NagD (HAD superfamily)